MDQSCASFDQHCKFRNIGYHIISFLQTMVQMLHVMLAKKIAKGGRGRPHTLPPYVP